MVSATIQDLIGYFPKLFAWNDSLDGDKLACLLLGMVYLEVSQHQRQLTRRNVRAGESKKYVHCLQQVSRRFSNKTHKRNCL